MSFSYQLGHFMFRSLAHGLYDYRTIGLENTRFEGGAIIVSNHISFFDPPVVGIAFEEEISFFARKTLFRNPVIGAIFRSWHALPIDQDRPDPGSLKNVLRTLRGGRKVLVFPEGSRSFDGKLGKAEAGVGLMIAKSGVPVLPARIFGAHEALPRGAKFPQPSHITVAFGPLWHPDIGSYQETGRDLYLRLADEAMEKIASLHD